MSRAGVETPANRRDERRERIAALSGVAFVVLLLVHAALQAGNLPTLTDPADDVVRYMSDKKVEIQIGAYLQGLAVVAYVWFLGSLWQFLRRTEGGAGRLSVVAAAATAVGIGLVAVHIAILTGLALRADQGLNAEVVSALYLIAFMVLGMSSFACAAFTGAVGALVLRTGALPRWFGGFSLTSALLWLLAGVGATTENDVWGLVGLLAFLVWLTWTATASVLVARRVTAADVAGGQEAVRGERIAS